VFTSSQSWQALQGYHHARSTRWLGAPHLIAAPSVAEAVDVANDGVASRGAGSHKQHLDALQQGRGRTRVNGSERRRRAGGTMAGAAAAAGV
jgi:hypothetical protein